MQMTSLKLTAKPIREAVIRLICFTALLAGRCCGVLDSWDSSLISVGTVGWGVEGGGDNSRSPLHTGLFTSQP